MNERAKPNIPLRKRVKSRKFILTISTVAFASVLMLCDLIWNLNYVGFHEWALFVGGVVAAYLGTNVWQHRHYHRDEHFYDNYPQNY